MCRPSTSHVLEACILFLILGLFLAVPTSRFTPGIKATAATRSGADPITFKWTMRPRFGVKGENGLVDYHWNGDMQRYEDSYVNPKVWTVDFDGCAGLPPQSVLRWEIDGQPLSESRCSFARDFPALQTYVVKLTATTPDGQMSTAEASVTLRDLFIVSIGDSFASGEGNPDKPRHKLNRARWVDAPCHRSALAGPALAAILLEEFDPHSAVTFISFACSGAVIEHVLTSPQQKGSRLVQPQLKKVFEAAGQRTIDALLISIGGNDVHFGDLVLKAIKFRHADRDSAANQLAREGLDSLPARFAALAQRIADPTNTARVTNVFITQYPDLVRDETRDFCDHSTPVTELLFSINGAESEWALNKVVVPLNEAIQSAATNFGWNYVDGILSKFGGDSSDRVAHGFCADDKRWVNTFNDSWRIQGDKNGTVHPNLDGYSWYAQRLFQALRPKLLVTP